MLEYRIFNLKIYFINFKFQINQSDPTWSQDVNELINKTSCIMSQIKDLRKIFQNIVLKNFF